MRVSRSHGCRPITRDCGDSDSHWTVRLDRRHWRGSACLHAPLNYAPSMSPPATLLMWFQLRSPELAEDFERLMTGDRDIVRGSLDTVSDWRLTRPADVPGQAIDRADYVIIAEIVAVERKTPI